VLLTSRGNRDALPEPVTRLGVCSAGGVLAGGTVAAVGLLFPARSRARQAAFTAGGVPAALGSFALPATSCRQPPRARPAMFHVEPTGAGSVVPR
jgi:hypothetical protein